VKMRQDTASQIRSFVLPFTVLVVVPLLIIVGTKGFRFGWGLGLPYDALAVCIGLIILVAGLYLLIAAIMLFMNIGKGTLAPWSPPEKLVVIGPYGYVRNPMISGVLIALLGESIILGSIGILSCFILFFIINHIYFILSEEPGLLRRFGNEYIRYKDNVPRWIPKLSPWKNDSEKNRQ
jgi:protein-S-isoprenylcysteine O-methyltransferase Ste14